MKKLIIHLSLLLFCKIVYSQVNQFDLPSYGYFLETNNTPQQNFNTISNHALINNNTHRLPIDAKAILIEESLKNIAQTDTIDSEMVIYRFSFQSDSAASMQLCFTNLELVEDEELWFYNEEKTIVFGPYTVDNVFDLNYFYSPIIPGDKIYLEFMGHVNNNNPIQIKSVIHGIGLSNTSLITDDCLENIKCPGAENWQAEAKSVVKCRFYNEAYENYYSSSGFLVNYSFGNNENYLPYLVTAFHNIDQNNNNILDNVDNELDRSQFIFNTDPQDCSDDNELDIGNLLDVVAGGTLVYANSLHDIAVIKLNRRPNVTFNAYLSGLSFNDNLPNSGVMIHIPQRVDNNTIEGLPKHRNKKISFSSNEITGVFANEFYVDRILLSVKFMNSTSLKGSSGSPFFNENKKALGVLSFSFHRCNNFTENNIAFGPDKLTYYGKFSQAKNETNLVQGGPTLYNLFCATGCLNDEKDGISLNSILCNNNLKDYGEFPADCAIECNNFPACSVGPIGNSHNKCTACSDYRTYKGRNFNRTKTRRVKKVITFTHRFNNCLGSDTDPNGVWVNNNNSTFIAGEKIILKCAKIDPLNKVSFYIDQCTPRNCVFNNNDDDRHGIINQVTKHDTKLETRNGLGELILNTCSIFPNPANNNFTINASEQIISYVVYDASGKQITRQENVAEKSIQVSSENLQTGIYFVNVITPKRNQTTKLMISKD